MTAPRMSPLLIGHGISFIETDAEDAATLPHDVPVDQTTI